ncbi:hypothetical protein K469DRAFT_760939 [Zopfia rhizophila CBS 207.26]|uniref:Uncharacterized protein n=1 Tax=Zopfia rhizophila CBS 207.26 TaxID=1314779 RepID=A0A6A6DE17_9PEZI|nr:hypothetical protein K469DRAFT_760939 [Zopfia rhizophila CBS 207.26]
MAILRPFRAKSPVQNPSETVIIYISDSDSDESSGLATEYDFGAVVGANVHDASDDEPSDGGANGDDAADSDADKDEGHGDLANRGDGGDGGSSNHAHDDFDVDSHASDGVSAGQQHERLQESGQM